MSDHDAYASRAKVYDVFDQIFRWGGKGNPRSGLVEFIKDKPLRVLDLCVGTAGSSMWLAKQNPHNEVVGIDLSEAMLSVAQKKISAEGLRNIELRRMSADRLLFEDGSFDAAMISFALHEMEPSLRENIYQEVARVLKPGGLFCLIDFAQQKGLRNKLFLMIWGLMEPGCFWPFLRQELKPVLSRYRLNCQEVKEYSFSNLYVSRKV